MKKVVDQLSEADESKAASNALFQWRSLRRICRHDLKLYAEAMARNGIEQLEYPACMLLKDEDARAEVSSLMCTAVV